jgi:hypothetical protein
MIERRKRSDREADARAYCRSIGADPDALVWGPRRLVQMPRWRLYVSQGAADRSPVYSQED